MKANFVSSQGNNNFEENNIINNKINYEQLNSTTEAILRGDAGYTRYTEEETNAFIRSGRTYVEASLVLGASIQTNTETSRENKKKQIELITEYAANRKILYDNPVKYLAEKYGKNVGKGGEATVFYDGERGLAVKDKNLKHYNSLQEIFDSIVYHNTVFPETIQKIVGFGKMYEGDISLIIEQPYIIENSAERDATQEEIDKLMAEKEFYPVDINKKGFYTNGQVIILDLYSNNVIVSEEEELFVIDNLIYKDAVAIREKYGLFNEDSFGRIKTR